MAKQTPKQSLACHRNWFKFKLAGMYFPFDKESLTSEEYEKWNKMQELRNSLLEDFEKNSIAKGLKVGGNKANIVMDYEYWESLNENSVIDSKLGARNLTPIEYERLQTLPDNYTKFGNFDGDIREISDSQRYKCIGNGWTHEIINHIINERYNTRTA